MGQRESPGGQVWPGSTETPGSEHSGLDTAGVTHLAGALTGPALWAGQLFSHTGPYT